MPGELIRTAVQNLIGGVSQQPNSVRLENQCEVQDNAYSHVVDGLGKRQPVEHVRLLEELPDGAIDEHTFVHWVNRSSEERYVVLARQGGNGQQFSSLRVFDATDGTEMTVEMKADATIGLFDKCDSAKADLRAATFADTTYLLCTKQTPEIDDSVITDAVNVSSTGTPDYQSKSSRRWFLFLRSSNFLTRYAVRVNTYTGEGHTVWPDRWDPPVSDYSGTLRDEWLKRATAHVKTFNGEYITPSVGTGYGNKDDRPAYDPANKLHEGYQIPTVEASEVLKLLWDILPEPQDVAGRAAANTVYWGGIRYNYANRKTLSSELAGDILEEPQVHGPVLKLEMKHLTSDQQHYRESMRVQVVGSGDSEDSLVAFSDEVQRITQLPKVCEHGHVVKIAGLEENDDDEHYVEFEVTDIPEAGRETTYPTNNVGKGVWVETVAPLSKPRIQPYTMPVKLERQVDAGEPKGYKFVFDVAEWADKKVGDEESNPEPSFIGKPIKEIFLWRNRLGFVSGSRIIMSEADEYGNFWRTTVKQLLDSDPIDLDASHTQPADLRFAVPLEEELVLFSDRTQFLVTGDPILTPRTGSIVPVTYYDALNDVRPEPTERGIFFPYQVGGQAYSQMRQWQRVSDDSFDADEVSLQVPRYIRGKIVEMTATSLESVMAVRTNDPDSPHVIWLYKWLDRGDQRLLSSWMRFTVGPADSTEIVSMQFLDDSLVMLVKRSDQVTIERIVLSGQRQTDSFPQPNDPPLSRESSAFRCLLDRRVNDQECTVSYDSTNLLLDILLPYRVQVDAGSEVKIVSRRPTESGPEGEIFAHTSEDVQVNGVWRTKLRVPDDHATLWGLWQADEFRFFVGMTYTMVYEFSEPTLRERRPDGTLGDIKTGRYQLLRGTLSFEDTGYFSLTVGVKRHSDGTPIVNRDDVEYRLPLLEVGLGRSKAGWVNIRSGKMDFAIHSLPEHCRILVENDSPYPCNPKSLELIGSHARRSRRFNG